MYNAYRWYPKATDLFERKSMSHEMIAFYCGDIYSAMVLGNLVHTSTVLFRRERLMKTEWYPEDYRVGEDYPFYLRACKLGPVAFVDQVTIHYQLGMTDALTENKYNYQLANNFLKTLMQSVSVDSHRIQLPKHRLNECLASAHAWAARESLERKMRVQAIKYYIKSFSYQLWQPSRYLPFLSAALPHFIRSLLVSMKRKRLSS